jgi:hypothetical protein
LLVVADVRSAWRRWDAGGDVAASSKNVRELKTQEHRVPVERITVASQDAVDLGIWVVEAIPKQHLATGSPWFDTSVEVPLAIRPDNEGGDPLAEGLGGRIRVITNATFSGQWRCASAAESAAVRIVEADSPEGVRPRWELLCRYLEAH